MTPLLERPVPFRARRSMSGAACHGRLYLFGGVGAHTGTESILDVSDELWSFDLLAREWRQVARTEPWPSPRRCGGWTTAAGQLWLWGGSGVSRETYTFLDDLWTFDPAGETWAPHGRSIGPAARYTPVFEAIESGILLFSGYTESEGRKGKLDDAWLGQASGWEELPRAGRPGYGVEAEWPGPRYGAMSAAATDDVFVCGGASDEGDHNDLWRFSGKERGWRRLAPDLVEPSAPAPRYCAVTTVWEQHLILFGGRSRHNPKANFNDLWVFDLDRGGWTEVEPNRHPHCYGHDARYPGYHAKSASARVDGSLYLWGGEGLSGHVSDFWRLDLQNLTWELLQPARSDDPELW